MSEKNSTIVYTECADAAVHATAERAMRNTDHRVIGTQHIFLGVMKEGPVANLLSRSCNVTSAAVTEIVRHMPKPSPKVIGAECEYTDGAQAVLDKAKELAKQYRLNEGLVYIEHVALALLMVNDEAFSHVMTELGIDYGELFKEVTKGLEWKVDLALAN